MATQTTSEMKKETIAKLQELIQINIDSAKGFEEAAGQLKNATLSRLCWDIAMERQVQANDLSHHVAISGEVPAEEGTWLGALRRSWSGVRAALSGDDEFEILSEAEASEDHVKAAYEDVLKETSSCCGVSDLVTKQYAAVKMSHDRIRDLRDARG
jgi:uncharacterized protein (TIGR02284 family)